MREASFTLPLVDGHGHPVEWLHEELVTVIVLRFGSCTKTEVTGAWSDNGKLLAEKGRRYTVAVSDGAEDVALLDIAAHYAKRAAQKALYHVSRHGAVQIINLETEGK